MAIFCVVIIFMIKKRKRKKESPASDRFHHHSRAFLVEDVEEFESPTLPRQSNSSRTFLRSGLMPLRVVVQSELEACCDWRLVGYRCLSWATFQSRTEAAIKITVKKWRRWWRPKSDMKLELEVAAIVPLMLLSCRRAGVYF